MAERRPAWVPREFFDDPESFGTDGFVRPRPPEDLQEAGAVASSLAQHLAALVVADHRRAGLTVKEMAERLGTDHGYLGGQLSGRYPAGYEDLARWAIVLDDVTVLPIVDSIDLFRPPSD
jgi:hypothetical protein